MTENIKLLINFVWKILGTVCFRNDHIAAILGYGDLKWGNITNTRVYFVEGLGHNLFLTGQFCDADLEVAFRRNTCFIRDLDDIGKLSAKGDIGFFIRYFANSVAYRVYNQRTKKIMETINVTFDELSVMAFEQNGSRPDLSSMTSGQISSELDLTYAPSTITPQRPSERDLDILFVPLYNEYLDADYAGCKDTFKSTSGGAQFLGENLVSWSSKKQESISCNPIQHSRTKHIVVCYHFIKEHMEKGMIELYFVKTDYQLANIFTKPLPVDRFNYLVRRLGMRSLSPQELDRLAKSQ
nr:retrovirus-related Pol polyprotein from transposon TNT 1-94 [Tanacetum cinerariifolium]